MNKDKVKAPRFVRVSFPLFKSCFPVFGQNWYDSWYRRTTEARKARKHGVFQSKGFIVGKMTQ